MWQAVFRRSTQEVIARLSVDGSSSSARQTDFNNVNLIIEKDPAVCAYEVQQKS